VTRTFATLAAAVRWRADALDALRVGETPPGPPPPPLPLAPAATVADAAISMGRGIRAGTVRTKSGGTFKPSHSRRMESLLRVHVLPRIGGLPAASVTRRDVQAMVDSLAAEKGPETARKALHALATVMRVAERDDTIDANPCRGVTTPKAASPEPEVRILDRAELVRVLDAARADDERLKRSFALPLVALAFGTGLRLGELLALRWAPHDADDGGLDLDNRVARVRWSLDRARHKHTRDIAMGLPKHNKTRDAPVPREDVAALKRHRLACGRPDPGALVFGDRDGSPLLATGGPTHTWRRVMAAAGIAPTPKVHAARHTWAVMMLRAGVTPQAVAKVGGWASIAMVLDRYGRHAYPAEIDSAADALEAYRASARDAPLS
jgi:integrase